MTEEKLGPMQTNDPMLGKMCVACQKLFQVGDYTTLIVVGPGDNPDEQLKCREGFNYKVCAVEVHYACATGIVEETELIWTKVGPGEYTTGNLRAVCYATKDIAEYWLDKEAKAGWYLYDDFNLGTGPYKTFKQLKESLG